MQIVIIDGRGGKLGAALTEAMLRKFPDDALLAVGINAAAAEQMHKSGAKQFAVGENPVMAACRKGDLLLGPVELVLEDSMLGEVSHGITQAVAESKAMRILIPMHLDNLQIAGIGELSASELIEDAVQKAEQWKKGTS